jgi:predicted O-methyltransferase YrrM
MSSMRNPLAFAAGVMALLLVRDVRPAEAEAAAAQAALDQRVEKFLASRRGAWRDMNVPEVDGRTLRDLIVRNGFRRALEIGTSTGHSAIWIAWGLSRTGGRLITIDIDPERHREAVANFQAAGLSDYIGARLADAHVLVPQIEGPFDFASRMPTRTGTPNTSSPCGPR